MPRTSTELSLVDLARPLSREALIEYAEGGIPTRSDFETAHKGIFIRIGGLIIVAPQTSFGPRHQLPTPADLLQLAADEYFTADDSVPYLFDEPKLSRGLHDAGRYTMRSHAEFGPTALILSGSSRNFGRAGQEDRRNTVSIAQQLVGNSVEVTQVEI